LKIIKVVSIDDHQSFSDGLKAIFENESGVNFLYAINKSNEALSTLKQNLPDVILLDIKMGYHETAGIELCAQIKAEFSDALKIVMLSQYDEVSIFKAARKAGADGHLLKTSGKDEIMKAIQAVTENEQYFGKNVTQIIVEDSLNETPQAIPADKPYKAFEITDREYEVLNEIKDGKTNIETANALFIAESTVKSHIQSLLSKAAVKNRTELINWARAKKLIA